MFEDIAYKIAIVAAVIVAIFYSWDMIRSYTSRAIVYPRQRVVRTVIFILVELLILFWLGGMMFAADREPIKTLLSFFGALVIVVFIVLFALIDMKKIIAEFALRSRELTCNLRNDDTDGST